MVKVIRLEKIGSGTDEDPFRPKCSGLVKFWDAKYEDSKVVIKVEDDALNVLDENGVSYEVLQ